MSISNDSSLVELIASSNTTVTTPADIDVIPKDDLSIRSRKNEYSIIGDGIYASVSAGPTPPWLTQILDSVISAALGGVMSDMANANANILQAISEIEAARNTYVEQINIDATIDGIIASRLATLNASLGNTNNSVATILELQTAFVTADQAVALSANTISASLNTPGGVLHGTVGTLESVITTLNQTVATNYDQVMAQMGDLEASVTQSAVAFVTDTGDVGASFDIDLKTTNLDANGTPFTVIGGMNLTNNGVTTSAGFDVDSFWLGKEGANGRRPFEVNGTDIILTGGISVEGQIYSHNFPDKSGPITGNPTGFRIDSQAAGTYDEPNIYGGYIRGPELYGGNMVGTKLSSSDNTFVIDLANKFIYIG